MVCTLQKVKIRKNIAYLLSFIQFPEEYTPYKKKQTLQYVLDMKYNFRVISTRKIVMSYLTIQLPREAYRPKTK